jgi:hypothetical protein
MVTKTRMSAPNVLETVTPLATPTKKPQPAGMLDICMHRRT